MCHVQGTRQIFMDREFQRLGMYETYAGNGGGEAPMRIILAGGGTGGHLFPGIAIYEALKIVDRDLHALFVGANGGVEKKIFAEANLPHRLLPGRGLRGASMFGRISTMISFMAAFMGALKAIVTFKPDVVIGTGGYASAAVVMAAIACRKTRVLQEQNSVPGMVNRRLARFAHLVLLSYAESRRFLPERVTCAVVGNPLRFKPGGSAVRDAGIRFLGLRDDLPTVVIVGGSGGAHSLNTNGLSAAKQILENRKVQFVIVAGDRDYRDILEASRDHKNHIRVLPLVEEMDKIYSVADVVVSRAGASSVFELALFARPTIFVPYSYAADDHQRKNVVELEAARAVVVIDDRELNPDRLERSIIELLDDEERRNNMAHAMKTWAKGDAAEHAAEIIMALVKKKRSVTN